VQAPILDRVSTAANVAKMDKLQTRRISALLNQNLTEALAAYDEAYALWPIFRNVDEIRMELWAVSEGPNGPDWPALYGKISPMDLRGVPDDLRTKLKAAASGG
jgi:hypothetical protein